MKVGIICVVERKLEPFLSHFENCKTSEKAMLKIYEEAIKEIDIVTLISGVCTVNSAIATKVLIDHYHVTCVINAATCGRMVDSLNVFDTVISTEIAYHDVSDGILTESHLKSQKM